MKTSLETVAAQRDELSMKLRAAIMERDAALAEVARLNAARLPSMADGGYVPPPSQLGRQGVVHGEVPIETSPAELPPEPIAPGMSLGLKGITPEVPSDTPPKPKRTGLFGKKS